MLIQTRKPMHKRIMRISGFDIPMSCTRRMEIVSSRAYCVFKSDNEKSRDVVCEYPTFSVGSSFLIYRP